MPMPTFDVLYAGEFIPNDHDEKLINLNVSSVRNRKYVTNTISYGKYETPIARYKHCGWQSASNTSKCNNCQITIKSTFIFKSNKHHCRFCGTIVCNSCSQNNINKWKICDLCFEKKEELKYSLIKMTSSPFNKFRIMFFSKPIKTNNNIFLFISLNGIFCYYDSIKNKWSVQQDEQLNKRKYKQSELDTFALNRKTNKIFGIKFDKDKNPQKLIQINLMNNNTTNIDITSLSNNYKLKDAKCIFINNEYHIIADKHYIWDNNNNILIPKCNLNDSIASKYRRIIYLESKQILYSFGAGFLSDNHIYKCVPSSFHDKFTWTKLNVKTPDVGDTCEIISCQHDKYILVFKRRYSLLKIFIFDVEQEIFTKSLVELPDITDWFNVLSVFIPTDFKFKMKILLSGYFRSNNEIKSYDIPQDIMNLLITFSDLENDFVHILGKGEHWKVNINYILNNTTE
eukprot:319232_1